MYLKRHVGAYKDIDECHQTEHAQTRHQKTWTGEREREIILFLRFKFSRFLTQQLSRKFWTRKFTFASTYSLAVNIMCRKFHEVEIFAIKNKFVKVAKIWTSEIKWYYVRTVKLEYTLTSEIKKRSLLAQQSSQREGGKDDTSTQERSGHYTGIMTGSNFGAFRFF